jgi:16S rRNA (cytidine1402-2'-O)-methyltransferase
MGTLYLVSTPIGNLQDITLRALDVLRRVALIAAEDTRHTRHLLSHYDIATSCLSYHHHNRYERIDHILLTLQHDDVALVSDAGTPALSDPGFELVQACLNADFPISPIPGASAPTAALVVSGLPVAPSLYLGFLPRQKKARQALLASVVHLSATLICFEAPHRLLATLKDLLAILGDRRMVVAREMTKMHEEFVRGAVSEALLHFTEHAPRGEVTLVIAGSEGEGTVGQQTETLDASAIRQRLRDLAEEGYSSSAAARLVAREMGIPKNRIYQIGLGEE